MRSAATGVAIVVAAVQAGADDRAVGSHGHLVWAVAGQWLGWPLRVPGLGRLVGRGLQFQAPVHVTAVPDHSYGYHPGVVVHVVDDPVVTHPYSQPWPVAL